MSPDDEEKEREIRAAITKAAALDANAIKPQRDAHGRLLPGETPLRPVGQSRLTTVVRNYLKDACMPAARVMVEALKATKWVKGVGEVPDWAIRMAAAEAIHNRIDGRPAVKVETPDGKSIPTAIVFLPPEN